MTDWGDFGPLFIQLEVGLNPERFGNPEGNREERGIRAIMHYKPAKTAAGK